LAVSFGGHPHQRADGVSHAPAFADHASHVIFGDPEFQVKAVALTGLFDFNFFWMFNQRFGDVFYEGFHWLLF